MEETVSLIMVLIALFVGFIMGFFIKVNYTYEVYDDVMKAVENVIMEEVENEK